MAEIALEVQVAEADFPDFRVEGFKNFLVGHVGVTVLEHVAVNVRLRVSPSLCFGSCGWSSGQSFPFSMNGVLA